ncbi:Translin-associated protein X [Sciurus carolinensis]|uniref:Translin-associated protein X n=1 Tax=Sciurus carolinensis TaxID=30640 RepID=A0AA41MDM9_SCICA|nr:Translin-associated protein X [Sciurus carolinensis]
MSRKEADPGAFRKRKHDTFLHGQRTEGKDVSSSSPVIVAFKAQELDMRHKYERLVKLSRDITVESIYGAVRRRCASIKPSPKHCRNMWKLSLFNTSSKTRSLTSMDEINKQLVFTTEDSEKENKTPSSDAEDKQLVTWKLKVTSVDYILGVADFIGELMQLCINSVGNGDIDTPFEVSQFLHQVYNGFTFLGNTMP